MPATSPDKAGLSLFLSHGGFGPVWEEHTFHPSRAWRFDFYLPAQAPPVAIEYDGVLHHGKNHGHVSISGVLRDAEKTNEAHALGIRTYRANAKTLQDGSFTRLLERVLEPIPQEHA